MGHKKASDMVPQKTILQTEETSIDNKKDIRIEKNLNNKQDTMKDEVSRWERVSTGPHITSSVLYISYIRAIISLQDTKKPLCG